MKRYLKYILLPLVTGLLTVSCLEEIEAPQPVLESEELTLVPRVKSFTNQYVTKAEGDAGYTSYESKITHLAYLIFNSEGALVHKDEADVQNGVGLTLNKTNLNSSETAATVVMFANVNLADIKKANEDGSFTAISNTLTLEDFDDYGIHLTSAPVVLSTDLSNTGFKGFPMKGVAEGVNLTTSSKDPIVVSLQILYAKVNFEISVAVGTENQGTGAFTINSLSVYNAALATNIASETFADNSSTYTAAETGTVVESKEDGTYTFYVSENRYNPGESLSGIYPSDNWLTTVPAEDVKGYAEEADNDKLNGVKYFYDDLIQQYKPILATKGAGQATYALLSGVYTDYRGTVWNVEYKIYLGKDNSQNFEVDRNSEYSNTITIKGIRNNGAYGEDDVWVDHRVNVSLGTQPSGTGSADDCVTITRETLIDSHIEVRPLRVKWDGETYAGAAIYLPQYPIDNQGNVIHNTSTTPNNWSQIDEVIGGANENWIAIENKNESSKKGRQYLANGKRKYFTTSLIEELNVESSNIIIDGSGHKYISMANGDCAWIYFDENASSNTRRAKINVVFYTYDNTSVTETYDVYQSGYTPIGDLKVENYEEYLHSYDSEDNYNLQTSFIDYTQQGLNWGFQSNRVSVNMHASPMKLDPIDILGWKRDPKDYISDEVRYDYFHENDGTNYYIYSHDGSSWHDAECGTGLDFTIRAANAHNLTVTDMGAVPQSAYEYCLSKNKFHEDADGNHSMIVRWYLPDVYELNSLFLDSYTSADMAKDAYYWSSQPSSTDYGLASIGGEIGEALKAYSIKNEVTDKARAVSKSGAIDITRETVNRIRCFYNTNGESMDMSERVPSGLGGLIKVPMKAYVSYSNTNPVYGYFSAWLTDIDDEKPQQNTPSKKNHNFPTGADADDLDHFVSNNVYYYEKDPTTSGAWKYSTLNYFGNTLYSYPGLTIKEVVLDGLRSVEGTNDKKYERSVAEIGGEKIESMPSTDELSIKPLDYLEDTDILTISFSNGTNGSKSPSYSYRREEQSKVTYSQRWILPKYEQININETTGSVVPRVQVSRGEYTAYELSSNKANYEYVYNGVTHLVTSAYKEGSIISRKYYFDLGPKTVNRPGYKYVAGTGGWGNKNGELGKEDSSPPSTTIDTKYDKLEFFGGNSFTIESKDGYRIKSIRVNYSDNNNIPYPEVLGAQAPSNNRYLRILDGSTSLPLEKNDTPPNMSYSGNGNEGWFQWTSPDETGSKEVTLKLGTYTTEGAINLGTISRPSSFTYIAPESNQYYQSDFETSIVIDSFEIRIEEVDEPTTIE